MGAFVKGLFGHEVRGTMTALVVIKTTTHPWRQVSDIRLHMCDKYATMCYVSHVCATAGLGVTTALSPRQTIKVITKQCRGVGQE